jgi:hypothetical protein
VISDPNPFGDRERLGILEHEATAICGVCGDVDCLTHTDGRPSIAEEALSQVQADALVIAAAREVLDAWDVTLGTDRRMFNALSALSDSLAKRDGVPF